MKKRVTLITMIMVIVFTIFSMASSAQEQRIPTGKAGGSPYLARQEGRPLNESRGMMDLELSEEQTTKINKIILNYQKESLVLKSQILLKQLDLQELLLELAIDMEKVRVKLEELASLQVEAKVKAIEHQIKIKEVLTEEQLEELSSGFPMQRFGIDRFDSGREMKGNRW
jgi:Spy/CpxP family protein refolding chaperone